MQGDAWIFWAAGGRFQKGTDILGVVWSGADCHRQIERFVLKRSLVTAILNTRGITRRFASHSLVVAIFGDAHRMKNVVLIYI
jgi:hypothetical protein